MFDTDTLPTYFSFDLIRMGGKLDSFLSSFNELNSHFKLLKVIVKI